MLCCFFFNDTATTEIYTLSLHDALPILHELAEGDEGARSLRHLALGQGDHLAELDLQPPALDAQGLHAGQQAGHLAVVVGPPRSEEHTSELQSRQYLVCRLLLEKKKTQE